MNKQISLGVALVFFIVGSTLWGYPYSINFSFISVILYLVSTVILFVLTKSIEEIEDKNILIYPFFGFLLVLCFMPILNYLALSFSFQHMHQVSGVFGQKKMEVSATEVTVIWGKWYAQTFYALIGAGIGYLIAKKY